MLFNTLEFACFFAVVTLVYFRLPQGIRWLHLLLASCVFYMAFMPAYILILFFTITLDYFAGRVIEATTRPVARKVALLASLVANLGVLAVFKYHNFAAANLNWLLQGFGPDYGVRLVEFILPVGLSFHTFQAMAYVIEVYRGHQPAERHFGIYALYVMFYPQLVAGPVERPQNLIHQFREEHTFDYGRVTGGMKLMLWGLLKKCMIADRAAAFVDPVFADPGRWSGPEIALAAVLYAFQIYCDFSGYCDIAIGAARVIGYDLVQNFRQPYLAANIGDFWQRWHISLSTWFRDYVYLPLGGNRVPRMRWAGNVLLVFLLSGLWHGASWTFVAWGALHGAGYVAMRWTRPVRERLAAWSGLADWPRLGHGLAIGATFLFVSFAWIFFRSPDFDTAGRLVRGLFEGWTTSALANFDADGSALAVLLAALLAMGCPGVAQCFTGSPDGVRHPAVIRWGLYYAAGLTVFFMGRFGEQQFIYFQF